MDNLKPKIYNPSKIKMTGNTIDSYFITGTLSLIAAFTVVLQSYKPSGALEKYISITSIIALAIDFLFFVWCKHRYRKRIKIFNELAKKMLDNHVNELKKFTNNVVKPFAFFEGKKEAQEIISSSRDHKEALKKLELKKENRLNEDIIEKQYGFFIKLFVKSLEFDKREIYRNAFKKPLEEKYSKIKFYLDFISFKLRYHIFLIGFMGFFLTLIIHILNQK